MPGQDNILEAELEMCNVTSIGGDRKSLSYNHLFLPLQDSILGAELELCSLISTLCSLISTYAILDYVILDCFVTMGATDLTPIVVLATVYEELNML